MTTIGDPFTEYVTATPRQVWIPVTDKLGEPIDFSLVKTGKASGVTVHGHSLRLDQNGMMFDMLQRSVMKEDGSLDIVKDQAGRPLDKTARGGKELSEQEVKDRTTIHRVDGERRIQHVPIRDYKISSQENDNTVFAKVDVSKLPEPLKTATQDKCIKIPLAAHVVPLIRADCDPKTARTFKAYSYYESELGLTVVAICDIEQLEYKVDLECIDAKKPTDAIAFDILPKKTTQVEELLTGSASLKVGLSKALEYTPISVDPSVEIRKDFAWKKTRHLIDATGKFTTEVTWKIRDSEMVDSFEPRIIIKARKKIDCLTANVTCTYSLKRGIKEFLRREVNPPQIVTGSEPVTILPWD